MESLSKKAIFIQRQLSRIPEAEIMEDQVRIRCPFHDDSRPSLDVSLIRTQKVSVGGYNCWSCTSPLGHGGWNQLAKKLNLELWDPVVAADTPENLFGVLAQQLKSSSNSQQPYERPVTEGSWGQPWRALSCAFLDRVGAERLWDKIYEEYRLFFPIHSFRGEIVGHVAARAELNTCIPDKVKYMNSVNFPADRTWYLLNQIPDPRILVIVEGPYDALRFFYHGVPAIACLGVKTLTEEKILQLVALGCKRVVLALDGDNAGKTATLAFGEMFAKYNFEIANLGLPEHNADGSKCDPGNCALDIVGDLLKFIEGERAKI